MANRAAYFVVHGAPGEMEVRSQWASRWEPRTDIFQTPDAIIIQIEVPGLDQDQLRLNYDPHPSQLTVEGRRERLRVPQPARCLQVEIEHGPFQRVFALPPDADGGAIEATYEAGLLLITVPRRQKPEPVNVRVNVT